MLFGFVLLRNLNIGRFCTKGEQAILPKSINENMTIW